MQVAIEKKLGIFVQLNQNYEIVLEKTIEALKAEGFGVLTEIDVKDTLKKKLGADLLPYKILGACNPGLAHRALTAAPEVGLLLPCNVTVRQLENGSVEVGLIDPIMMLGAVNNPDLGPVAEEARTRLLRAAAAIEEVGTHA